MIDVTKLDVSNFLPHRPPFLMVDKVLSIDEEHVATSFKIKEDNLFIANGFFSEIGLVECAAQACSSIIGKSYFEDDDVEGKGTKLIGFISGIKKMSLFSCPRVNTEIIANAKLISRFDTAEYCICTLSCSIVDDSKEFLNCEMNLFIQEVK